MLCNANIPAPQPHQDEHVNESACQAAVRLASDRLKLYQEDSIVAAQLLKPASKAAAKKKKEQEKEQQEEED